MRDPIVRDSVEFFKFTLDERDGQDITGDTVQCAIEAPGTASPDWIACTWDTGNVWRTTDPITWSSDNYPATTNGYVGWAKVGDTPETPWVSLGVVTILER